MQKKSTLSIAIGLILVGASMNASANLTSSATLNFTLGTSQVIACKYGTTLPCSSKTYNVTDLIGSYFAFDDEGDGVDPHDKIPIESFNGIHLGTVQGASGSSLNGIDGTELPNIDMPWEFLGPSGMHQTTSPITVNGGSGDSFTLDMSGWGYTWNTIENVSMVQVGATTITCETGSGCSDNSSYTLDGAFNVSGGGFTNVSYSLHLEGTVSSVPVPAAAWLFGSGLIGLAGLARRKKSV